MSKVNVLVTTGHLGLNVTDVERSKKFYQDVFGLEVKRESREEGRRFAFLGDSQRLVLTLWEQSEEGFSAHRSGLHHMSFEVESVEEVTAAEERLRRLGAEFAYDGVVPHSEGAASGGIFFHDPDGIRLEIYSAKAGEGGCSPHGESPTCGFF